MCVFDLSQDLKPSRLHIKKKICISGFSWKTKEFGNIAIRFLHVDNSPDVRKACSLETNVYFLVLYNTTTPFQVFSYLLGLAPHLSKILDKRNAAHLLCLANLASPSQNQHLDCSFEFLCVPVLWSMDQKHQHDPTIWKLWEMQNLSPSPNILNQDQQLPELSFYRLKFEKHSLLLLPDLHFIFNSVLNFQTEACFHVMSFCPSWMPRFITYFEILPILQCAVQIYILSVELPPNT